MGRSRGKSALAGSHGAKGKTSGISLAICGNANGQPSVWSHPWHPQTSVDGRPLDQIRNEQRYLEADLHRQDRRIRERVASLADIEARKSGDMPLSTGEARELRKRAGYLKSQIHEAERQEDTAIHRLAAVLLEMRKCYRADYTLCLERQQQQQQQQQNQQNQNQLDTPALTPIWIPETSQNQSLHAAHTMSALAPEFRPQYPWSIEGSSMAAPAPPAPPAPATSETTDTKGPLSAEGSQPTLDNTPGMGRDDYERTPRSMRREEPLHLLYSLSSQTRCRSSPPTRSMWTGEDCTSTL